MAAKADTTVKQNTEPQADKKYSCKDLLKELVLSSNLEALKKFRETAIRIENISDNKITIEVYAKEMSDRTGELRTVENTVAWLEFIPESKKLYDITADPESPVDLNYDKTLFTRHSISELCGLKTAEPVQQKTDVSCKEITGEMASGQECILSSTTFEKAYQDLINKGAVNDSKYLPKQLPAKNTSMEINKDGLMNIDFKITGSKVSIEMLYAGGTTDIAFEKQENNVKRTVIYNAD
ncbi:hypothetical protein FY557_11765 [Chryseobacterium sp. SN22]|uniref:hypothetical protein n=1 Tax=Chryseobacterium sp. SN22 TaxID=2606431 RepID=UPI0011EC44C3|nr:hypothetical protein [Chryseobacterium sp. SN22]KAA0127824.1 hypothetical protein FY557_11765 [Chryseobacterium sp. SN22]